MKFNPAVLLPLLVVLSACRKDKPEAPLEQPASAGVSGVYVLNEGNFNWGNAGVSFYNKATGGVVEDLFGPANGTALGDVLQSMQLVDGKGYLVVNNSGKVVEVDTATFAATATITGLTSPRYLLPVGGGKAYVTDLYANAISVVDLHAHTVIGAIPCPGWTEELVLSAGKAFVTNKNKAYVYVVDTGSDQVVDSIGVSRGGNSIVEDAHGKLWVACTGGAGTQAALYRIDPVSMSVEASFPFSSPSASPWRLVINGERTVLYFLNDDVCRMNITDTALPAGPLIPADGRTFYGLGVDPADGTVHVSDAIDYTQRGRVFRYTSEGVALGDFLAGRIPGGFVFR
ncbi:MAG: hypothetical protein KBH07_06615 [Flavobacteriales bacterium]|nr:hypothetical protein [Flavobacteriales bacterium]MBP9079994.1 hypothetical protein [Flavobacteriales bacterium]